MYEVGKFPSKRKYNGKYPDPSLLKGKEFEVNNWIISEFIIKDIVPTVGTHPYPLQELALLVSAVCYFKPDNIFEWGTHLGKSARIFYEVVTKFNLKTNIFTIDLPETAHQAELPPKDQVGFFIKDTPSVKQVFGDGLTESMRIVKKMKPATKLLFFLDGDHSYKSVCRELETIDNLKQPCCIIIHDAFFQSSESDYNVDPYEAVKNFLKKSHKKYHVIKTDLGLPGMIVLL